MLPLMQLAIELELTPDVELLYGEHDTARLVIDRFYLWVPRLEPKDALMTKFISEFQKPTKWTYLREMYQSSAPTRNSGDFRISSSIDKVKHVFIYFQRNKTNDMPENPYIFHLNLMLVMLIVLWQPAVLNIYPELDYDSESISRIFSDLMNYSWKNDYNTGTQLNPINFKRLYGLIYFDLSYQTEQITRDPKQIVLKYRINQASAADFMVHAIVLYEEDIVVDKVGDQLVII